MTVDNVQLKRKYEKELDELSKDRTLVLEIGGPTVVLAIPIFISHNLLNFDKIIVLEDGKIVENGNHAELIKQKGYYADMYYRQQQKEQTI